jgi:hypothetical protein
LACRDFAQVPFNLYTDSANVCGVIKAIETSYIGHTSDEQFFYLFHELQALFQKHQHFYFMGYLGPILAFLVHWQRATSRPMPWFLH